VASDIQARLAVDSSSGEPTGALVEYAVDGHLLGRIHIRHALRDGPGAARRRSKFGRRVNVCVNKRVHLR
jgi:hypothetical protein